ncbi:tetratricopeptide repeat protein [Pseudoduganella sp. LjRoot289]|uniref:tetratricopeptide repeat protein n=1 Tax=Pseudoduganella sp. LjRoot289 TaxID=3342314 RepID=UPI003ECCFBCB
MMTFILSAGVMLALALLLVLRPLLAGGKVPGGGPGQRQAGGAGAAGAGPLRGQAVLVSLMVVALSVSLYYGLGTPRGLQPEAAPASVVGPDQVQAMVARLAARLKEQPGDAAGWRMLARSYETLRRFDDAAEAYRQVIKLEGETADLLVDYSVALGMSTGQRLSGEPQRLLERALALDPNHVQALALLGSAALETGDRAGAVRAWKRILALVPADSEIGRSISASIGKAQTAGPAR